MCGGQSVQGKLELAPPPTSQSRASWEARARRLAAELRAVARKGAPRVGQRKGTSFFQLVDFWPTGCRRLFHRDRPTTK